MGKIQIGSLSFKSQASAKKYIQMIRDHYKAGEVVSEPTDDAFLRDLILLHSESSLKIDCGIDYFKVELEPVWKTSKCFVIYRTDASSTDFSFLNCIGGPDHEKDVCKALRYAVRLQITDFKHAEFTKTQHLYCPHLKTEVLYGDCDVDHFDPSFRVLSQAWLQQNNLTLKDIELIANADNQYIRPLKSQSISESWEAFHQKNASLRITSSLANRAHAKPK